MSEKRKAREFWIDPTPCDEEMLNCFDALSEHPGQGPLSWQASLIRVREVLPDEASELERLRAENERLKSRVENSRTFYTTRIERIKKLLNGTEFENAFFNIVANGTADVLENPTFAQQINLLQHNLSKLREAAEGLRESIEEAKKSIRHSASKIEKINIYQHGDLHGCDCEGGCNCKPKLWVDLEEIKYHCYGSDIAIDEALAKFDAAMKGGE